MSEPSKAARAMKSRSGALLRSAIESGGLTREQVIDILCITAADLDLVLADRRVLSLPHQLCLATLVIERLPGLARHGHALRAQVVAAMAFADQQTVVHSEPPGSWVALKRSPTRAPHTG